MSPQSCRQCADALVIVTTFVLSRGPLVVRCFPQWRLIIFGFANWSLKFKIQQGAEVKASAAQCTALCSLCGYVCAHRWFRPTEPEIRSLSVFWPPWWRRLLPSHSSLSASSPPKMSPESPSFPPPQLSAEKSGPLLPAARESCLLGQKNK